MLQAMPDFSQDGRSATPGVCASCRSHERHGEPVVFTNIHITRERGRIELCAQDIRELASHVGMISPERAVALLEEVDEARKSARIQGTKYAAAVRRAEAAESELEVLREEIAELRGKRK